MTGAVALALALASVVVDAAAPERVAAVTAGGAVVVSDDGGDHWRQVLACSRPGGAAEGTERDPKPGPRAQGPQGRRQRQAGAPRAASLAWSAGRLYVACADGPLREVSLGDRRAHRVASAPVERARALAGGGDAGLGDGGIGGALVVVGAEGTVWIRADGASGFSFLARVPEDVGGVRWSGDAIVVIGEAGAWQRRIDLGAASEAGTRGGQAAGDPADGSSANDDPASANGGPASANDEPASSRAATGDLVDSAVDDAFDPARPDITGDGVDLLGLGGDAELESGALAAPSAPSVPLAVVQTERRARAAWLPRVELVARWRHGDGAVLDRGGEVWVRLVWALGPVRELVPAATPIPGEVIR